MLAKYGQNGAPLGTLALGSGETDAILGGNSIACSGNLVAVLFGVESIVTTSNGTFTTFTQAYVRAYRQKDLSLAWDYNYGGGLTGVLFAIGRVPGGPDPTAPAAPAVP
jgi:hypothetical protein